ncbi:MAG: signal peptidase II [Verrucomicrobiales bacterium]|jgi:signal peptidase II
MPFLKTFLCVSLPLYVLDQITKWIIVRNYDPPIPGIRYDSTTVIPGFFDIVRVHNTGVAFGRFNGTAWANLVFGAVAIGALIVIGILWRKNAFPIKTSQWAVFLLFPGILGNLTDRFVHGYVVDFLSFDLKFMVWPSFNVADACICVAAGLLAISAFLEPKETAPKE